MCLLGSGVAFGLTGCDGCSQPGVAPPATSSAGRASVELSAEQRSRVLARVGERTITLGDYVSALDRMDHFERLRYQTPERRKQLLDEMINVELLAREAERRGLDQQPETQAHITQLLREELVSELRRQQPKVEELPASEVKRYYDDHPDEFQDPERRRVAVIATASAAQAKKNLAAVAGKSAKTWGKVARESGAAGGVPLEFEGDLGDRKSVV